MTKTDWTKEELKRAISKWRNQAATNEACSAGSQPDWRQLYDLLTAFANRIEADERAVVVGLLTIELDRWYVEGIRMEVEAMKVPAGVYPLFTHPPAQAAQVNGIKDWQRNCPDYPNCPNLSCPCEPKDEPAQEQPGWKWVPEGWVLVPRIPTIEMLKAMPILPALPLEKFPYKPSDMQNLIRYQAALAASPTPPKEN